MPESVPPLLCGVLTPAVSRPCPTLHDFPPDTGQLLAERGSPCRAAAHPAPPSAQLSSEAPSRPSPEKARGLAPPGRGEARGPLRQASSRQRPPQARDQHMRWMPPGRTRVLQPGGPRAPRSSGLPLGVPAGAAHMSPCAQQVGGWGACPPGLPSSRRPCPAPSQQQPPPRPCPPSAASSSASPGQARSQPHHSDPVLAPGTSTSQPHPGQAHVYLRPRLGSLWQGDRTLGLPTHPHAPGRGSGRPCRCRRSASWRPAGVAGQTWQ